MRSLLMTFAATAAVALSSQASAQTIGCELGGVGGVYPTSGTGGGTFPTTLPVNNFSSTINVASIPSGATCVSEVRLNGLTHTWLADVSIVLTDPAGGQHNLWVRGPAGITSCDWNGNYVIVPECAGLGLALPASCTGTSILPQGAYDQFFGTGATAWPSGTNGINNTPLNSIAAATGAWTLTFYDWAAGDSGTLLNWDICFGTPVAPSAPVSAPTLASPAANAAVFGPNVNFTWGSVPCATSYEIDIDGTIYATPSNAFAFGSSTAGAHTWTARGLNATGTGPWAVARTYNDLGPAPTPCNGTTLTTVPFTGGNGLGTNSAVFFDINVANPAGVTISQLKTNANATAGTNFTLEIWTKPGTYVGSEQIAANWALTATGGGISVGNNVAGGSLVEFTDFILPPGVTGFALRIIGAGHSYTNGNGSNQTYANADMTITLGKSQGTLFSSAPINPRVWNGSVIYNCSYTPAIVTYCTGGTTTNGCVAAISADNQPSVSAANACNISVANVEGQKSGLIFYSISGQHNATWNATSFLCVKSPTQRTGTQVSTGTVNLCDGTLSLDWNAYQATHPTALGQPFSAGNKVQVQAWFRDPPAGKSTNLSNAIELTYVP